MYVVRLLSASLVMTAVVLWLAAPTGDWLNWGWERRAREIAVLCAAGVAAYLLTHLVAGTRLRHLRAPSAV